MKHNLAVHLLVWAAMAAVLNSGCVRIYVASPDVLSMKDPPGVKIGQVISDLRTIGVALEAYSVDQNTYPTVNEADLTVGSLIFANVERLESQLKNYLRRVSPVDPWGRPYLYRSTGKSFVLFSLGSDGAVADSKKFLELAELSSQDRVFVQTQNTTCLEDEILFSQGQFLAMPKYSASECQRKK